MTGQRTRDEQSWVAEQSAESRPDDYREMISEPVDDPEDVPVTAADVAEGMLEQLLADYIHPIHVRMTPIGSELLERVDRGGTACFDLGGGFLSVEYVAGEYRCEFSPDGTDAVCPVGPIDQKETLQALFVSYQSEFL